MLVRLSEGNRRCLQSGRDAIVVVDVDVAVDDVFVVFVDVSVVIVVIVTI